MKKISFTLLLSLLGTWATAQCTVSPNAIAGITLQCDNTQGQANRSAVAFNPITNLYYSVGADGVGSPIETFDVAGIPVATAAQSFDYRGLWWNGYTNRVEGNGYDASGVVAQDLDGVTGYPLNTTTAVFSAAQPSIESVGAFDSYNNQIVYYHNNSFYRYNATTNAFVSSIAISGLPVPVSNLNSNTAFYVSSCPGKQYGVYDHVLKRFYFINEITGAYTGYSQLPNTAPAASMFQASYTNGKLWLFDVADYRWHSYEVMLSCFEPIAVISPVMPTAMCQDETPYTISGANYNGIGNIAGWLKNNVIIPGATGNSIQVTSSGYYAIVVANGGCADTVGVQITVNPLPVPVIVQNGNVITTTISYDWYAWEVDGIIVGYQPTLGAGSANGTIIVHVQDYSTMCWGESAPFTPVSVTNIILTELNVYPNPSNGTFLIKGHVSSQSKNATIKITDITGRTITEEEIPVRNNTIEKQMNLSQLSAGTYMLFIMCDNERQVIPLTIN